MKAYTDIEQSKKLAEILPLESADCYWEYDEMQQFHRISWFEEGYEKESQLRTSENNVCAWSLAALLSILPQPHLERFDKGTWICSVFNKDNHFIDNASKNDPVDACYEMILKLHKLKLL